VSVTNTEVSGPEVSGPEVSGPEVSGPEVSDTDGCAIREVLDRVGDKWSVLIVALLGRRTHRFNELHRSIDGISQRMLTLTLRTLERDGLVRRTVHASVPPRVDYELTDLGRTLLVPVQALADWARAHRDDIRAARTAHDRGPGL
jgi:DNA-binding HxlR family transcriptional regulator